MLDHLYQLLRIKSAPESDLQNQQIFQDELKLCQIREELVLFSYEYSLQRRFSDLRDTTSKYTPIPPLSTCSDLFSREKSQVQWEVLTSFPCTRTQQRHFGFPNAQSRVFANCLLKKELFFLTIEVVQKGYLNPIGGF